MACLLLAGSVFFPGLYLLFKQALMHLWGWSEGDAATVSTRLVSSLQAVMATCIGGIIVAACADIINDRHWLTDSYILFATPYFVYDVFAMFVCDCHKHQVKGHPPGSWRAPVTRFLRRDALMVLHHIFMVAFCCPVSLVTTAVALVVWSCDPAVCVHHQVWRGGKGDYFQGLLFMAELSTPFVSLGKVLIQFKLQHTLLHKVNGVMMMLTFFFCRVLLFPFLYVAYSRFVGIPVHQVAAMAPWQCNLGAALLWPLQLYWFLLICRGAVRLLTRPPPGQVSEGPPGTLRPRHSGH
ncbi:TLC domain containing 3Ba isoform X1 [Synchiropus splendidus]|uniref:TLC domain containing 3Ba isoform X1 n=1 Tax=Synchiropus splendidus TaxID=270530 RepID=UPI00237EBF2C|nr:TLC domain containing 3Ba isoform X1 [Synchiropus splendidus]